MLVALSDAGAEFVLIGGHAVAYHGHVRATTDMDVLVRAGASNARRVFAALARFGAPLEALEVTVDDLATYDGVAARATEIDWPALVERCQAGIAHTRPARSATWSTSSPPRPTRRRSRRSASGRRSPTSPRCTRTSTARSGRG